MLFLVKEKFSNSFLKYLNEIVLAQCDMNNPNQKWTFNQEVELFN